MDAKYLFSLMMLRYIISIISAMFFTLCGFLGLLILSMSPIPRDSGRLPALLIGLICVGFSWAVFRWSTFANMMRGLWNHYKHDKTSLPDFLESILEKDGFTWTCPAPLKFSVYALFLWCVCEVYTLVTPRLFGLLWLVIPIIMSLPLVIS